MAWVAFHLWKQGQLDHAAQPSAPVDFDTDTFGILLLDSTGAPPLDTTQDVLDMLAGSPAEITETNYARKALSSPDATLSAGTVTFDASLTAVYAQSASGFDNATYAVLYKNASASDGNSPVIAVETFSPPVGNIAGSLTIELSSTSGVFTFA
jgi:hypothetical protein